MGTDKATSGSFNTGPLTKSKSFSVRCTGDNGSIGAYTYVSVNGGGGGSGDNLPTLSVLATPSMVNSGGSSVISWTSTNTKSCDAGVGNGTGATGSFNTGALTSSKSFAISCTGDNGDVSFYTFVRVTNERDRTDDSCEETDDADCDGGNDNRNRNNNDDRVWGTTNNGTSGTWDMNNSSGTWEATSGTGGNGSAVWQSNGDGTGTWSGPNGSGTWKTTFGDPDSGGGNGSGSCN